MALSYTVKGESSSYTYTANAVSASFNNPWHDSVGSGMQKKVKDSLGNISDAQQRMINALSKLGDFGECRFEYRSMRHEIASLEVD